MTPYMEYHPSYGWTGHIKFPRKPRSTGSQYVCMRRARGDITPRLDPTGSLQWVNLVTDFGGSLNSPEVSSCYASTAINIPDTGRAITDVLLHNPVLILKYEFLGISRIRSVNLHMIYYYSSTTRLFRLLLLHVPSTIGSWRIGLPLWNTVAKASLIMSARDQPEDSNFIVGGPDTVFMYIHDVPHHASNYLLKYQSCPLTHRTYTSLNEQLLPWILQQTGLIQRYRPVKRKETAVTGRKVRTLKKYSFGPQWVTLVMVAQPDCKVNVSSPLGGHLTSVQTSPVTTYASNGSVV